jgi:hypothetical protein
LAEGNPYLESCQENFQNESLVASQADKIGLQLILIILPERALQDKQCYEPESKTNDPAVTLHSQEAYNTRMCFSN